MKQKNCNKVACLGKGAVLLSTTHHFEYGLGWYLLRSGYPIDKLFFDDFFFSCQTLISMQIEYVAYINQYV